MHHVGMNIEINKLSNIRGTILSDGSPTCHSPHSTFHVTTGSTVSAAIPFAVSRGPCGLVPCVSVNIILLTFLRQMLDMFPFWPQIRIIPNKHVFHSTSEFYKLSRRRGRVKEQKWSNTYIHQHNLCVRAALPRVSSTEHWCSGRILRSCDRRDKFPYNKTN
jgi:hypothetical protein